MRDPEKQLRIPLFYYVKYTVFDNISLKHSENILQILQKHIVDPRGPRKILSRKNE